MVRYIGITFFLLESVNNEFNCFLHIFEMYIKKSKVGNVT